MAGLDIVNREAVQAAMEPVAARLGTPTILVNNAGLGSSPVGAALENGPFEDYPEAAWDAMIDSHLKGAFFVSQAFFARTAAQPAPAQRAASSTSRSTYGVVTPDQSLYEYRRRDGGRTSSRSATASPSRAC